VSPRKFVKFALALVLLLAVAGSVSALDAGAKAPEIGLKDQHGKQISMAGLKGKVVIVDFFASWCAPCRDEMPVLQHLYKKYGKDGLVVVGVSVDKERQNAIDFAKKLGVTFPIVHDGEHGVAKRYEPKKMPSSFIIDRSGKVSKVHAGFHKKDAAEIEKKVKSLL